MTDAPNSIFIVEDETLIAMELKDRLGHLGYAVLGVVARGEDALQRILETQPDLVLMDINLAGSMSGIEVSTHLRASSDVPVVFLTAYSDQELLRQAAVTEPYGYLVKPFAERELHATIQMAFHKHQIERELRWMNTSLEEKVQERTLELEALNADLRASETLFRSMAEVSPATIYRLAVDGTVTYVSPAVVTMFNLLPDVPIGKSFREFVLPADAVAAESMFAALLAGRVVIDVDLRFVRADGTWFWGSVNAAPITDDGRVIGMQGVIVDVNERRAAEEELRRQSQLQRLVAEISAGLVNLTDGGLDDAIASLLERIGTFFGVDRGCVYRFSRDLASVEFTWRWHAPGTASAVHGASASTAVTSPVAAMAWAIDRLRRHEVVILQDVTEQAGCTEAERRVLQELGARSLIWVPIEQQDELLGFFGFDTIGAVRTWTIADETLLRVVGDALAGAFVRERAEQALNELNRDLERRVVERTSALVESERRYQRVVENIGDALVVEDASGRLAFANDRFLDLFGYQREDLPDLRFEQCCAREFRALLRAQREPRTPGADGPAIFEFRGVRKDGTTTWLEARASVVFDDSERAGVQWAIRDISERKRAEEALQRESRFRQAIIGGATDGICVCHEVAEYPYVHFTVWNQAMYDITGYTLEEINEHGWYQSVYADPEVQAQAAARMDRMRVGDNLDHESWEITRKDGQRRWVSISTSVVQDGAGDAHVLALMQDITERTRAEAELAESRHLLSESQRIAAIGSWQVSFATGALTWTDETYRLYGVTRETFVPSVTSLLELIHPEDRPAMQASVEAMDSGLIPDPLEFRVPLADGSLRLLRGEVELIRTPEGQPISLIGTVQDVTRQRLAETALRESEERYRRLFEEAVTGIFHVHLDGTIVAVNPAFARMLGYASPSELIGVNTSSFYVAPEDRRLMQQRGAGRDSLTGYEVAWRKNDGDVIMVEIHGRVVHDDRGQPVHYHGSAQDITARKQAEDAARLAERAIATSINAVAITDASGRLIHANPAFVRLWGYSSEREVLGMTPLDFAEPVSTQRVLDELRSSGAWQGELVGRRKDGSTFDVMLSANVLLDANGNLVNLMGSFLDVSESKHLQAQFLQAQKMETVGRLAGGVAHDFNNLLTVITGHTDLALSAVDPRDPLRHDLSEIGKAADSAASLTQQLLAFSRRQIIQPEILNLNDVVTHLENMLRRLIGEDIDLRTIVVPGLGQVRFDRSQCEQLLVNLAVNARDAMPNGGKLTLETANVELDDEYARRHPDLKPGAYVMLAVSDTGAGMSEDVKSHIFEPFFTTKASGSGTGLGLAMVYGAVSQNGGRIEVYSELGHGTTFKIYLPQVQGAAAKVTVQQKAALPRGSETIVLVEDEVGVRALASLLLKRQGYVVHAFGDGQSALDAVKETSEPVHLLMTDVIMPGMNGRQLADLIREIHPAIKVLFTSGYTANVIVQHGVLKEGVDFIGKPYRIEALARRVRELLDKPGP